jgi:hypothetical protein
MAVDLFFEIFQSPNIFTIGITAIIATIVLGYIIVRYMKSLRIL